MLLTNHHERERLTTELRKEADEIAHSLISDVSFHGIAGEVEWELESHDLDELNSRAEKTRWGYTDPTDAAHEILFTDEDVYGSVLRNSEKEASTPSRRSKKTGRLGESDQSQLHLEGQHRDP